MADEKVTIEIDLDIDGKGVTGQLKGIERKAETSGKKAGREFGDKFSDKATTAGDVFKGALGANLVAGAIQAGLRAGRAFVGLFGDAIDAAGVQESAVKALNASLEQTGQYSVAASQDIQDFASSLQSASKFGDEVTLQNAALIQTIGQLDTSTLKRAVQAAADFAVGANMSFESASQLVSKAAAGQASALSRYGITVTKGANDTETFANALDVLESKFGGRAAKEVDTYATQISQLGNTFGDLLEDIGFIITKSPTVISAIKGIGESIDGLRSRIALSSDITKATDKLKILQAQLAKARADRAIEAAQEQKDRLIGLSFYDNNIARAEAEISKIKERIEAEKLLNLEKSKTTTDDVPDKTPVDQTLSDFEALSTAASAFAGGFGFGEGIEKDQKRIKASAKDIKKSFKELAKESKKSLQNGLGNAASAGFAALGSALVTGENALAAFAKAMISSIGQTLVQLGTNFILKGIAYSFDPLMGGPAVGGPLIGAGAAMVVAGGAMSALGGGSSVSTAGSTSTSNSTSTTTSTTDPETDTIISTEEEFTETQTVQVVVNGDIFDSNETSLRIIDLLNNSFETDGTRLVTA